MLVASTPFDLIDSLSAATRYEALNNDIKALNGKTHFETREFRHLRLVIGAFFGLASLYCYNQKRLYMAACSGIVAFLAFLNCRPVVSREPTEKYKKILAIFDKAKKNLDMAWEVKSRVMCAVVNGDGNAWNSTNVKELSGAYNNPSDSKIKDVSPDHTSWRTAYSPMRDEVESITHFDMKIFSNDTTLDSALKKAFTEFQEAAVRFVHGRAFSTQESLYIYIPDDSDKISKAIPWSHLPTKV